MLKNEFNNIDQILVPLRYTGSQLIVTGSDFIVSGSSTFLQTDPNNPAVIVSGSDYIVDSLNVASGSLYGNPLDGGSF